MPQPVRGPFRLHRPGIRGLLLFSLIFAACGRKDIATPTRYVVASFENLSGDASLDWTSRGAGEYLSRSLRDAMGGANGQIATFVSSDNVERNNQSLGSRPLAAPGVSAARAGAIVAGANRFIVGYVERTPAGIRIAASEEDVTTNRALRHVTATGATPFDALKQLAQEFSPNAGPAASGNAEAFRVYCTSLENPVADAAPLLERAVTLDPAFGDAWTRLARTYAALGDRDHASATIQRARAQKLRPFDSARLDFEDASLRGDRPAVLTAMRKLYQLDPSDADLGHSLAEGETLAGNFSQAAVVWKKLTVDIPSDANAWNQLGYARSWSGDYAGAISALDEYARVRPADANPLDSRGDVQFWFGKYADAAISYAAAYQKSAAFLNGGELYKEAWARFLAGDKTAADGVFGKFRAARESANDPSVVLLAGDWLYRTGRTKEAVTLLREGLKKPVAPAVRGGISSQLAIWDLLAGDRGAAAKDAAEGGTTGLTPNDFVVRFAAMPTAPLAEWETRAARILATPQVATLRTPALAYALILDGKKQAAVPLWEEIVKQATGSDFFHRAILARLKNQPVEHVIPPDPVNLNPFASVLAKL